MKKFIVVSTTFTSRVFFKHVNRNLQWLVLPFATGALGIESMYKYINDI